MSADQMLGIFFGVVIVAMLFVDKLMEARD
jgi:hypothetical protein